MPLFRKDEPTDKLGFLAQFTDDAIVTALRAFMSIRDDMLIALEAHRPLVNAFVDAGKKLGMMFVAKVAMADEQEREKIAASFLTGSEQYQRLLNLYNIAEGAKYRCPKCQSPFPNHDCMPEVS